MAIYKQASFDNGEDYPRYAILEYKHSTLKQRIHVVIKSKDNLFYTCNDIHNPSAEDMLYCVNCWDCELGTWAELYNKE